MCYAEAKLRAKNNHSRMFHISYTKTTNNTSVCRGSILTTRAS